MASLSTPEFYAAEYCATINIDHWLPLPGTNGSRTRIEELPSYLQSAIGEVGLMNRQEMAELRTFDGEYNWTGDYEHLEDGGHAKIGTINKYVERAGNEIFGPKKERPRWISTNQQQQGTSTHLWLTYLSAAARSLGISQARCAEYLLKCDRYETGASLRGNASMFRQRLGLAKKFNGAEVAWLMINGGLQVVQGRTDTPSFRFNDLEFYLESPKVIRREMLKRGIDPEPAVG